MERKSTMKKFLFLTASIFLLNFAAEAVDCPTADTINRAVEDTASFAKFKDAMDNIEGMKFQSFTPTKNLVTDKWSDDIQSFIYGGGQYAPTPFKSTKILLPKISITSASTSDPRAGI